MFSRSRFQAVADLSERAAFAACKRACLRLLAISTAAVAFPAMAFGTDVTVRVLNVSKAGGALRVALCRETEWEKHNCSYGANVAAVPGVVEVHLIVQPGTYGVLVHHDVNGDGKVDTTLMGVPVEGVGFSRNVKIRLGFPSFSSVCVPMEGDNASTNITLLFENAEAGTHAR